MSRLVVVSNRVAPIQEGEATAGGLAAGVLDALKQKGGLWFGWSGEVTEASDPSPERSSLERNVGPITLFTVDLSRRDYDEFYRGFANGTLWPVLPTRSDLAVSNGRSSRAIGASMIFSRAP
jgi:trehalose 6-phosphate synthase